MRSKDTPLLKAARQLPAGRETRGEKGSAILISLFLVLMFGLMGMSMAFMAHFRAQTSQNRLDAASALQFAKAGLVHMENTIYNNWYVLDKNEDLLINSTDGLSDFNRVYVVQRWRDPNRNPPSTSSRPLFDQNTQILFVPGEDLDPTKLDYENHPGTDEILGYYEAQILPERFDVPVFLSIQEDPLNPQPTANYKFKADLLVDNVLEDSRVNTNVASSTLRYFTFKEVRRVAAKNIDIRLQVYESDSNGTFHFLVRYGPLDPQDPQASVDQAEPVSFQPEPQITQLHLQGEKSSPVMDSRDILNQRAYEAEQWLLTQVQNEFEKSGKTFDRNAYLQDEFTVYSTGVAGKVARTLQASIVKENFLEYARFVENGDLTLTDGSILDGKVYCEGQLTVGKDVVFKMDVRVGDRIVDRDGNPTTDYTAWGRVFENSSPVKLPQAVTWDQAKQLAQDHGWYIDSSVSDPEINFDYFDYSGQDRDPTRETLYEDPDATANGLPAEFEEKHLPAFNGVIFAERSIKVHGHLHGGKGITVFSNEDIIITSSITSDVGGPDAWVFDSLKDIWVRRVVDDNGDPIKRRVFVGLASANDIVIGEQATKILRVEAAFFAGGNPDPNKVEPGSIRVADEHWPNDAWDNPPFSYADNSIRYNRGDVNFTYNDLERIIQQYIDAYYLIIPDELWYDDGDGKREPSPIDMSNLESKDKYGIMLDIGFGNDNPVVWPMWFPDVDKPRLDQASTSNAYADLNSPLYPISNYYFSCVNDIDPSDKSDNKFIYPLPPLERWGFPVGVVPGGVVPICPIDLDRDGQIYPLFEDRCLWDQNFAVLGLKPVNDLGPYYPSYYQHPDCIGAPFYDLTNPKYRTEMGYNEWRLTYNQFFLNLIGPQITVRALNNARMYYEVQEVQDPAPDSFNWGRSTYPWEKPTSGADQNMTCYDWNPALNQDSGGLASECHECTSLRNDCWVRHPNYNLVTRNYQNYKEMADYPPPHFPIPLKALKELSLREVDFGRLHSTKGFLPTPTPYTGF